MNKIIKYLYLTHFILVAVKNNDYKRENILANIAYSLWNGLPKERSKQIRKLLNIAEDIRPDLSKKEMKQSGNSRIFDIKNY